MCRKISNRWGRVVTKQLYWNSFCVHFNPSNHHVGVREWALWPNNYKYLIALPTRSYSFPGLGLGSSLCNQIWGSQLTSPRSSPSPKSKPKSNPKKGKSNFAYGLSLKSYGPPTPTFQPKLLSMKEGSHKKTQNSTPYLSAQTFLGGQQEEGRVVHHVQREHHQSYLLHHYQNASIHGCK